MSCPHAIDDIGIARTLIELLLPPPRRRDAGTGHPGQPGEERGEDFGIATRVRCPRGAAQPTPHLRRNLQSVVVRL